VDGAAAAGDGNQRLECWPWRVARAWPGTNPSTSRRRALRGAGSKRSGMPCARAKPGGRLSRATWSTSFWGDNHEHPPLMKTLYGLSWRLFHRCDCTGPNGDCTPSRSTTPHPALVRSRVDRLSLSRHPAGRPGVALVYWFARRWIGPWAAAGRGPCFRSRSPALLSFRRPISCVRCAHRGHGLAGGAGLLEIAARAPLGHSVRRLLWPWPGTRAQRLADSVFLLVHYLWMRRGDFSSWEPSKGPRPSRDGAPPARARAGRAGVGCPSRSAGGLPTRFRLRPAARPAGLRVHGHLGPIVLFVFVAVAVARARCRACASGCKRHAAARALQLRVPGPKLESAPSARADRSLVAARDLPVCIDGVHRAGHHLGLAAAGTLVFARRRRRRRPDDQLPSSIASRPSPGARFLAASRRRRGPRARTSFSAVQILGPLGTLALPATPRSSAG